VVYHSGFRTLNAPDRPNDTFAFTIFPYDADFEHIQAEIRRNVYKDIKQSKTVTENMLNYLRSAKRFSFCFVVNKDHRWFPGLAEARQAIDNSRSMMRHWKDADQQRETIKRFEALREDARANSFNVKLFGEMVLMNSLAAVIACLLIKHGAPEIIAGFRIATK
jgi:UDP-N-acetylmuramate-alanine ligase